ncbi:tRNA 2-thiouridine(34) synthase MnmA [Roseimaritima ulvae]|nr:tRNA 2-thiouridine(34) synthase MnmA [Roseimaritima ulvae]
MARIVLAMSGGVDSSAAAHLLCDAGHEVIGVFMRHGEESSEVCRTDAPQLPVVQRAGHKQGCCTASDAADARRVADRLGIAFYALNLQRDFRRIVDYFVDDYTRGRTPNPCVQCNNWIKFGRLFDYADGVEADFVATGHYAQLAADPDGGVPHLLRGIDSSKDQSYVLYGIRRDRLRRMLLPVGGYTKKRIRELAGEIGLSVADKKDSQEICFVTSGHHSDFVRARRGQDAPSTAGAFVDMEGEVVGQHSGYEAFTVGQRKGLGIALGEPHFVVRIEPETRNVVLGPRPALLRRGLVADDANWLIEPPAVGQTISCSVQIRYNSPPKPARMTIEDASASSFRVEFEQPEEGVAPGQAAVVYDGPRVLGGGWIDCSIS